MVERIARPVEGGVLRQRDRQVLVRHRHHVAFRAVDHRDRAAPEALARDAPVAQAEIHLTLADCPDFPPPLRGRVREGARLRFQPLRHLFLGLIDGHAVEEARIDHAAVAVIGDIGDDEGLGVLALGADHRNVAERVFVDEVEVALVVRRAAEDGAGAVFHQHEVRDVNRQLPAGVERMDGADAGVETLLLRGVDHLLRGADAFDLGDERGKLRVLRGCGDRQRMIGRDRHELGAEQGIGPRREDAQLGLAGRRGRRSWHQAQSGSAGLRCGRSSCAASPSPGRASDPACRARPAAPASTS